MPLSHVVLSTHLKFCRFCTHSKKLTTTPPAMSQPAWLSELRSVCFMHTINNLYIQQDCVNKSKQYAPPDAYMSGRTGMSRSRKMRSASGVVGPLAASTRN